MGVTEAALDFGAGIIVGGAAGASLYAVVVYHVGVKYRRLREAIGGHSHGQMLAQMTAFSSELDGIRRVISTLIPPPQPPATELFPPDFPTIEETPDAHHR